MSSSQVIEGTTLVQRRLAVALAMMTLGGVGLLVAPRTSRLALAQPTSPGSSEPATAPDPAKPLTINEVPPMARLGLRSAAIQQQLAVLPVVVIVPDESAYVSAISSWRTADAGAMRYPVLIDRGTYMDQQRIARFVRGFRPERVVRWKPPIEKAAPLPADRTARQRRLEDALADAWSAESHAKLADRWAHFKFTPAGVVAMWAEDPAWTAGLALAAGRGQPIVWVMPRGGGAGNMAFEPDVEAMSADLDTGLKHCGYAYEQLGDAIDAVTLAMNAPPKVLLNDKDPRKMLALTDMIGRGKDGKRFAWAGQIGGDSAAGAYMAMCSLFLARPERAWLFDGYDDTKPWVRYDASDAGEKLSAVGVQTIVDDPTGGGSLDDWRARIAGTSGRFDKDAPEDPREVAKWGFGVNAQLVSVTTSGNPDFFELKPGMGHSVDVPLLRTPAAVHFVHSWSANNPNHRAHISGVWMERGVFAYVGSVHEPFLSAFVPTPLLMTRLTAGLPWGVAPRIDGAEAWKIAIIGDPLYTIIARQPPRADGDLPLAGAIDVSEGVSALLKEKKYVEAVRALSLVGRDRDAARLLGALLRERPIEPTRELALAGISAAFAAGDFDTLLGAARVILPEDPSRALKPERDAEADAEVRDMIWHVLWPARGSMGDEGFGLLYRSLRKDNLLADARDLISHARALRVQTPSARDIVLRAQRMTDDRALLEALDKLSS